MVTPESSAPSSPTAEDLFQSALMGPPTASTTRPLLPTFRTLKPKLNTEQAMQALAAGDFTAALTIAEHILSPSPTEKDWKFVHSEENCKVLYIKAAALSGLTQSLDDVILYCNEVLADQYVLEDDADSDSNSWEHVSDHSNTDEELDKNDGIVLGVSFIQEAKKLKEKAQKAKMLRDQLLEDAKNNPSIPEALTQCDAALALDKNNQASLILKLSLVAKLEESSDQNSATNQVMDQLIKYYPDSTIFRTLKNSLNHVTQGFTKDYSTAQTHFRLALEKIPELRVAWLGLLQAYQHPEKKIDQNDLSALQKASRHFNEDEFMFPELSTKQLISLREFRQKLEKQWLYNSLLSKLPQKGVVPRIIERWATLLHNLIYNNPNWEDCCKANNQKGLFDLQEILATALDTMPLWVFQTGVLYYYVPEENNLFTTKVTNSINDFANKYIEQTNAAHTKTDDEPEFFNVQSSDRKDQTKTLKEGFAALLIKHLSKQYNHAEELQTRKIPVELLRQNPDQRAEPTLAKFDSQPMDPNAVAAALNHPELSPTAKILCEVGNGLTEWLGKERTKESYSYLYYLCPSADEWKEHVKIFAEKFADSYEDQIQKLTLDQIINFALYISEIITNHILSKNGKYQNLPKEALSRTGEKLGQATTNLIRGFAPSLSPEKQPQTPNVINVFLTALQEHPETPKGLHVFPNNELEPKNWTLRGLVLYVGLDNGYDLYDNAHTINNRQHAYGYRKTAFSGEANLLKMNIQTRRNTPRP